MPNIHTLWIHFIASQCWCSVYNDLFPTLIAVNPLRRLSEKSRGEMLSVCKDNTPQTGQIQCRGVKKSIVQLDESSSVDVSGLFGHL